MSRLDTSTEAVPKGLKVTLVTFLLLCVIAGELNLRGTPAYLINGQVYYGKIPDEALKILDTGAP